MTKYKKYNWIAGAAISTAIALVSPARAQWKVPNPATAEHPGARAAPASSPATYPDEAGFQRRARIILDGVAANDLAQWRRGYFAGGDPGKYLPGAAMAKLLRDPADAMARQYMNDERSPRENYHFAAVNWGRFLPLFGGALTPETKTALSASAARFSAYLTGGGTENHKTMWMTTANVLPHYLEGGRLANRDKDAALAEAKRQLQSYVKGLFAAGMGEWDSSTYLMFDVNGMLNIYDFSPDPECRLLAGAALDWLAAGYALKYTDGVFCGPNQRGYSPGPVKKIADQTGWLWWDSHARITPEAARGFLYTLHPITSSWRPNRVITNIARRNLPRLPFTQRNSKPNYWYGRNLTPTPNQYQETVYVTRSYTLGSLWNGFGGQITRFQLVAGSPSGGIVFTGGNPRASDHTGKIGGISYQDGGGRYDQSAQVGAAYVSLSRIPDDEPLAYSFFSLPEGVTPEKRGNWWVMRAGDTFIGLYGLGERAVLGQTDAAPGDTKAKPAPVLRFEGRRTGFVLQTGDSSAYPTLDAFAAALERRAKVDTSRFAQTMAVTYATLDAQTVSVQYQTGQERAAVRIDGKPVDYSAWPIYDGPYITQKDGALSVNDGNDGFVIDFTGDLPVYKAWKP